MFSRISQLGKNLTDELSRINDEVTSARTIKQGQLSNGAKHIDPELADRIMGVETPDLETITKPDAIGASTPDLSFSIANDESVEKKKIDVNKMNTDEVKHSDTKIDESKTDSLPAIDNSLNGEGEETGEVSKANEAEPTAAVSTLTRIEPSRKGLPQGTVVPGTGVKYSELPNEIIPLLLKFAKYEKKYPLLYDAYKAEKKKMMIVHSFEDVFKEVTPCTSIAQVDTFKDYLDGLATKSSILNEQLGKSNSNADSLTSQNTKLLGELKGLGDKNNAFELELAELKAKMTKQEEQTKKTVDTLTEQVRKEQDENAKLADELGNMTKEAGKRPSKGDQDFQLKYDTLIVSEKELKEKYEELLRSEGNELELRKENASLKAEISNKAEQIEDQRDMLRNVGDDLVESEKKVKKLIDGDSSDTTAELRQQLNANLTELEMLRVQNAEALKDYEQTKSSLTKKYQASLHENEKLETKFKEQDIKVEHLTSENTDLAAKNKELRDMNSRLQKDIDKATLDIRTWKKAKEILDSKIKNADDSRTEIGRLNSDLGDSKKVLMQRQQELDEKEGRIKSLQEEKEKLNDKLVDLMVQVKQLETEEKNQVESKGKMLTRLEAAKNRQTEITLQMNKVAAENNRLVKDIEELQDKYKNAKDLKVSNASELESMKKRVNEVLMRNREYESRIDLLEEQLTQSRTMLRERTREAGTMRKFVMDTESDRDTKIEQLQSRLEDAAEEKEKLENTLTIIQGQKEKRADELNMKLGILQTDYDHAIVTNSELEKQLKLLQVTKPKPEEANGLVVDGEYNGKLMDSLRDSLKDSEDRSKRLEEINNVLQKANSDNAQKLVRMNKKYKQLSQQYRRRRSSVASNELTASSPMSTRENSIVDRTSSDISKENHATEEDAVERAVYIRNVLLGFLEHKEQREMLLPVIKTLLVLSDEDEKKFLNLLGKA